MKILDSVFSMLKSGGQVLAIRFIAILLQFGFVWYITNYIGDAVYGDFVIYLMVTQFVGTISNLGIDTLIVKWIGAIRPIDNRYNTALVRKTSVIGLITSIVLMWSLATVINQLKPDYLPELPMWTYLLGAVTYSSMRIFVEYYRAIHWITVSTVFSFVVAPSLAMIFLWFIKAPMGVLYPLVVSWNIAIVFVIVTALMIKWFYNWETPMKESRVSSTQQILTSSMPFLLITIILFLSSWIDKMVLRLYIDADILGHYHVAYRLAAMVFLPLMAFNTLIAPRISRAFLEKRPTQELRSIISDVIRWAIVFAGIAYVCFLVLGKFMLGIFSEAHVTMYPILLILSFGQLVNVAAGPVGIVMKMTELQNLYARVVFVSMLLNFTLSMLLVPRYGVYGAAVGTAVGMVVVNVSSWYLCKKHLGLNTGVF